MIEKIEFVVNYNKLLRKKFGVFYYFFLGFLFLILGSLIASLGNLEIENTLCNFLRIIGFTVALFGGYYFLKFFIFDVEKWLPIVPLIIKGAVSFGVGAILWSLLEKKNIPSF